MKTTQLSALILAFLLPLQALTAEVIAEKKVGGSLLPDGNHSIQVLSDGSIRMLNGAGDLEKAVELGKLSPTTLPLFQNAVEKIAGNGRKLSLEERTKLGAFCSAPRVEWWVYRAKSSLMIQMETCELVKFTDSVRLKGTILGTLDAFDYYFADYKKD
jgi:hypothetical protein